MSSFAQPFDPLTRWRLPLLSIAVFVAGIFLGTLIGTLSQTDAPSPETAERTGREEPASPYAYTEFRVPLPSHEPVPLPAPPAASLSLQTAPAAEAEKRPPWLRYAAAAPPLAGLSLVAVVIDDLGVDKPRSARSVALPPPLTLSFLPYADDLARQTGAARSAGHELLVHLPMEPSNEADPGPNALTTDLPRSELLRRLRWDLSRFPGFVGVSNHMGSKFTADGDGMEAVMEEIASRGLLFLDSRTTAETVAPSLAHRFRVPFAERNVFLDNDSDGDAVRERLAELERMAFRYGYAVGIGHPHDATIEALDQWIPTLTARGFALVPVSMIVWRNLPEEVRLSLASMGSP